MLIVLTHSPFRLKLNGCLVGVGSRVHFWELEPIRIFVKTQQNYLNVLEDVFQGLMARVFLPPGRFSYDVFPFTPALSTLCY